MKSHLDSIAMVCDIAILDFEENGNLEVLRTICKAVGESVEGVSLKIQNAFQKLEEPSFLLKDYLSHQLVGNLEGVQNETAVKIEDMRVALKLENATSIPKLRIELLQHFPDCLFAVRLGLQNNSPDLPLSSNSLFSSLAALIEDLAAIFHMDWDDKDNLESVFRLLSHMRDFQTEGMDFSRMMGLLRQALELLKEVMAKDAGPSVKLNFDSKDLSSLGSQIEEMEQEMEGL
jgi:hypothetical protein